jgi:hypothetical protein
MGKAKIIGVAAGALFGLGYSFLTSCVPGSVF